MSSDYAFGGPAIVRRPKGDELKITSKPLPNYLPPKQRRRERWERIRRLEAELGLPVSALPDDLAEDETTVLFSELRTELGL